METATVQGKNPFLLEIVVLIVLLQRPFSTLPVNLAQVAPKIQFMKVRKRSAYQEQNMLQI